jgi:hypothetical protein
MDWKRKDLCQSGTLRDLVELARPTHTPGPQRSKLRSAQRMYSVERRMNLTSKVPESKHEAVLLKDHVNGLGNA